MTGQLEKDHTKIESSTRRLPRNGTCWWSIRKTFSWRKLSQTHRNDRLLKREDRFRLDRRWEWGLFLTIPTLDCERYHRDVHSYESRLKWEAVYPHRLHRHLPTPETFRSNGTWWITRNASGMVASSNTCCWGSGINLSLLAWHVVLNFNKYMMKLFFNIL